MFRGVSHGLRRVPLEHAFSIYGITRLGSRGATLSRLLRPKDLRGIEATGAPCRTPGRHDGRCDQRDRDAGICDGVAGRGRVQETLQRARLPNASGSRPQAHHPLGVTEWQRMPQDEIRNAEDDDGACDANGERCGQKRRHPAIAPPGSKRHAQVLQHVRILRGCPRGVTVHSRTADAPINAKNGNGWRGLIRDAPRGRRGGLSCGLELATLIYPRTTRSNAVREWPVPLPSDRSDETRSRLSSLVEPPLLYRPSRCSPEGLESTRNTRSTSVRSRSSISSPQPCLLQNTVQRSWCEVVARLTGDRHESGFRRVLELSMRTTLPDHGPTIVLQHLDYVANLHGRASRMVILPVITSVFVGDYRRTRAILLCHQARLPIDIHARPAPVVGRRSPGWAMSSIGAAALGVYCVTSSEGLLATIDE